MNRFKIAYLTYDSISKLTQIPLHKLYKHKSLEEFSALEQARLAELRYDMEKLGEKYKL